MSQTPAGWFPDPEHPDQLRYWDGTAWTEHRAPAQNPNQAPAQPPRYVSPSPAAAGAPNGKSRGGLWWKIALGVVAFFFLVGIIGAVANSSGSTSDKTAAASDKSTSSTPPSPKPSATSSPKASSTPSASPKPAPKPKATVGSKDNPAPRGTAVGNQSAVYQILNVSVTNSLGSFASPPAGRYVVIDLAVMNKKKSTIQVNMNDFLLQVNGVEIDPSSEAIAVDNAFTYEDISPGLTKRGKIVFDVAPQYAGKGVLKAQAYISLDSPVYLSLK